MLILPKMSRVVCIISCYRWDTAIKLD